MRADQPYEIVLDADPLSIRTARRFFADVATRIGLDPERVDVGSLALTELVTNAIVHARGPIVVRILQGGDTIRCEVEDCTTVSPRRGVPRSDRAGGRGLTIVNAVVDDWGTEVDRDDGGKRVWFQMPLVPHRAPEPANGG